MVSESSLALFEDETQADGWPVAGFDDARLHIGAEEFVNVGLDLNAGQSQDALVVSDGLKLLDGSSHVKKGMIGHEWSLPQNESPHKAGSQHVIGSTQSTSSHSGGLAQGGLLSDDQSIASEGWTVKGDATPEPPNYRPATKRLNAPHCGSCKMYEHGKCWGYGDKSVEEEYVCDSYAHSDNSHQDQVDRVLDGFESALSSSLIPSGNLESNLTVFTGNGNQVANSLAIMFDDEWHQTSQQEYYQEYDSSTLRREGDFSSLSGRYRAQDSLREAKGPMWSMPLPNSGQVSHRSHNLIDASGTSLLQQSSDSSPRLSPSQDFERKSLSCSAKESGGSLSISKSGSVNESDRSAGEDWSRSSFSSGDSSLSSRSNVFQDDRESKRLASDGEQFRSSTSRNQFPRFSRERTADLDWRIAAEKDELFIALNVPKPTADEIYAWAQKQDWPKGTELEKPEDYHITLLYSPKGHKEHCDQEWWATDNSDSIHVNGISEFPSTERGEMNAFVLRVDTSDDEIKHRMNRLLDDAESHGVEVNRYPGGSKPHITVAYGPKLPDGIKVPELSFSSDEAHCGAPRTSGQLNLEVAVVGSRGNMLGDLETDWGQESINTFLGSIEDQEEGEWNSDKEEHTANNKLDDRQGQDEWKDDESHDLRIADYNVQVPEVTPSQGVGLATPHPAGGLLSLQDVARNLHSKFEQSGLDPISAQQYASKLLQAIGYTNPDQPTIGAALQAWKTLYPEDAKSAYALPGVATSSHKDTAYDASKSYEGYAPIDDFHQSPFVHDGASRTNLNQRQSVEEIPKVQSYANPEEWRWRHDASLANPEWHVKPQTISRSADVDGFGVHNGRVAAWTCPLCHQEDNDECLCHNCGHDMHEAIPNVAPASYTAIGSVGDAVLSEQVDDGDEWGTIAFTQPFGNALTDHGLDKSEVHASTLGGLKLTPHSIKHFSVGHNPRLAYLDEKAKEIEEALSPDDRPKEHAKALYRLYALLALTKGKDTTLEDVHDAWSTWTLDFDPDDDAIRPLDELEKFRHAYDEPYLEAIHKVSKRPKVRKTEKPQKCKECKAPATKSLLWAEGMAYVPVCDKHEQKVRKHLGEDEVCAVHTIKKEAGNASDAEMVPIEALRPFREYDRRPGQPDGADQAYWDALKAHVAEHGFEDPLTLEYNNATGRAKLSEGNHRLGIAEELGMTHVPVSGIRSRTEGVAQLTPPNQGDEYGYFPGNFSPSHVGLPTSGEAYQQAPYNTPQSWYPTQYPEHYKDKFAREAASPQTTISPIRAIVDQGGNVYTFNDGHVPYSTSNGIDPTTNQAHLQIHQPSGEVEDLSGAHSPYEEQVAQHLNQQTGEDRYHARPNDMDWVFGAARNSGIEARIGDDMHVWKAKLITQERQSTPESGVVSVVSTVQPPPQVTHSGARTRGNDSLIHSFTHSGGSPSDELSHFLKSADSWDTRQWPDSVEGDRPIHQEPLGCTCQNGQDSHTKLTCPVHGLEANGEFQTMDWAIPENSPVGYPQDQPRNWQQAVSSVSDSWHEQQTKTNTNENGNKEITHDLIPVGWKKSRNENDAKTDQQANENRTKQRTSDSTKRNKEDGIGIDEHGFTIAGEWQVPGSHIHPLTIASGRAQQPSESRPSFREFPIVERLRQSIEIAESDSDSGWYSSSDKSWNLSASSIRMPTGDYQKSSGPISDGTGGGIQIVNVNHAIRSDEPHSPKFMEGKLDRPIAYDPDQKTVYVGQPGGYHTDMFEAMPWDDRIYWPQGRLREPHTEENQYTGETEHTPSEAEWFTRPPDNHEDVHQALGVPPYTGKWNFIGSHKAAIEHQLNWEPGNAGKGLFDREGNLHTWNVDERSAKPWHTDYIRDTLGEAPSESDYPYYQSAFYIKPNGGTFGGGRKFNPGLLDRVESIDPRLRSGESSSHDWDFNGSRKKADSPIGDGSIPIIEHPEIEVPRPLTGRPFIYNGSEIHVGPEGASHYELSTAMDDRSQKLWHTMPKGILLPGGRGQWYMKGHHNEDELNAAMGFNPTHEWNFNSRVAGVAIHEVGVPTPEGREFHGDRRPFFYHPDTHEMLLGPPGAEHGGMINSPEGRRYRNWLSHEELGQGGVYTDGQGNRVVEFYTGTPERERVQEITKALGASRAQLNGWHIGDEVHDNPDASWDFNSRIASQYDEELEGKIKTPENFQGYPGDYYDDQKGGWGKGFSDYNGREHEWHIGENWGPEHADMEGRKSGIYDPYKYWIIEPDGTRRITFDPSEGEEGNDWDFNSKISISGVQFHDIPEEDWLMPNQWSGRRPTFYDPESDTVHVGPLGTHHQDITDAAMGKHFAEGGSLGNYFDGAEGRHYEPIYGHDEQHQRAAELLNANLLPEWGMTSAMRPILSHAARTSQDGPTDDELHSIEDAPHVPWRPGLNGKGIYWPSHDYLETWADPRHHIDVLKGGPSMIGHALSIDSQGNTWHQGVFGPGEMDEAEDGIPLEEVAQSIQRHDPRLTPRRMNSDYDWDFTSAWKFAHVLNWQPGQYGKGLIHNGEVHTWPTEAMGGFRVEDGQPGHPEYVKEQMGIPEREFIRSPLWETAFAIDPEGKLNIYEPKKTQGIGQAVEAADPRLKANYGGDYDWSFGPTEPMKTSPDSEDEKRLHNVEISNDWETPTIDA